MLSRQESLQEAIKRSAAEAQSAQEFAQGLSEQKKREVVIQAEKAVELTELLKQFFASEDYLASCQLVRNFEAKEEAFQSVGYGIFPPKSICIDLSNFFGWSSNDECGQYSHFNVLKQETLFGRRESPEEKIIQNDVGELAEKMVDEWHSKKLPAEEIFNHFRNMFDAKIEELIEKYVPPEVGEVYEFQETKPSKKWMPVIVVLLLLIGAGIYFWP